MNKVLFMGLVIALVYLLISPFHSLNAEVIVETVPEPPVMAQTPATPEEKVEELLKTATEEQKAKKEEKTEEKKETIVEKPKKEIVKDTDIAIDARTWSNTMVVESVWYVGLDEIHVYVYCPDYIKHEPAYLESNCYEYLRMWLNGFDWVTFGTYTKVKDYFHYSKLLPNGQTVNMYEARFKLNRI